MWFYIFLIVTVCLIIAFGTKMYIILSTRYPRNHLCMVKKTVLITGANQGMGYYIALDFAKRGARVILACRKKDKAEEIRQKIIKATNNNDVIVKVLNLGSFKSIRAVAFGLLRTENRLDILINNAGIRKPNSLTEDGLHPTLQVNALGPYLFTLLLLDLLKSTERSRVVNLNDIHGLKFGDILDEFVDKKNGLFAYATNYANSKKCQSLLMLELSERLRNTNVSIHFSIPRPCTTQLQIYDNWPDFYRFLQKTLFFFFLYADPEDSVQNTIHCALSEQVGEKTGKFYKDCQEIDIEPDNINVGELRKIVWRKCCRMIKMTSNELNII